MAAPGPADPGADPARDNPAQERPRTPWAERFGVHSYGRWKLERSSGLHPAYPDIPVDNLEELPPEADASPIVALDMPDDAAMDRLFSDEAEQKSRLDGFPMYQAVVFNKYMPVHSSLTGRVDEASWLPFFEKVRGGLIRQRG